MTAIQSAIILLAIIYLVFFLFEEQRVDRLRQDLFAIRDDLFDEAAAGHIQFDSNAYGVARETLNGMIRFAHKISFVQIMIPSLVLPRRRSISSELLASLISETSPEERRVFNKYMDHANFRVVKHMFSSPLLFVFFLPARFLMVGTSLLQKATTKLERQLLALDSAAYREGKRVSEKNDSACSALT